MVTRTVTIGANTRVKLVEPERKRIMFHVLFDGGGFDSDANIRIFEEKDTNIPTFRIPIPTDPLAGFGIRISAGDGYDTTKAWYMECVNATTVRVHENHIPESIMKKLEENGIDTTEGGGSMLWMILLALLGGALA